MAVMVIEEDQDIAGQVTGGRQISVRDILFWGGVAIGTGIMLLLLIRFGGLGPTGALMDALALAFGATLILVCLLTPYFLVRSWRAWRTKQNLDEYEHRYSELISKQSYSEAVSEIDLDTELDFEFEESDTSPLPPDSLSLFDDDSVSFADVVHNELEADELLGSGVGSEDTIEFVTEYVSENLDEVLIDPITEGSDLLAEGSDILAEGSDLLAEGSDILAEGSFAESVSPLSGDIETQTEFINIELERGFENSTPDAAELESFKQQLDETLQQMQGVSKSGDPVRDLEAHEFDLVCLRYVAAIGYKTPTRCKGVNNQFEFAIREPNSLEPYALVRCIPQHCVIEAEFLADVNLSMLKAGATCGILFTRFPVDPITIKAAAAWDFEVIDSEELNQRLEALPAAALSKVVPAAPMESSAVTLDSLDVSNINSHPSFGRAAPLGQAAPFQRLASLQQPVPTPIQDFLNEAS